MNRMNRFRLRNVAHVAAMMAVTVMVLRCGPLQEGAHEHEDARLTTSTALLVSTRASLQVCLQVDSSLKEQGQELVEKLQASLRKLEGHPDWKAAQFGAELPEVILGCPGEAWPTDRIEPKDTILGPGVTDEPSPYRTFVYVVDDESSAYALGEDGAARGIAELMRVDDHNLAEVSTALVVRASELGSERFETFWLPWSVGLVPEAGFEAETKDGDNDYFMKKPRDESLTKPVEDASP